MKFCRKCGSKLHNTQAVCDRCGTQALDVQQSMLVFHYNHGSRFDGSMDFKILENETGFVLLINGSDGYDHKLVFPIEPQEFIELLNLISPCFAWAKHYGTDTTVGYKWSLSLDYGSYRLETAGQDSYPQDYQQIRGSIHQMLENWRRTRFPNDLDGMLPPL